MSGWPEGFALARLRSGPPAEPTRWAPCPHCLTLVRGAHTCPVTPEKLALLRLLFVRNSLRMDRSRCKRGRRNVVELQPARLKAGR